ncbi:hypothetical protein HJG60_009926 [Phyllostomus discolor]|uniref:Uncharacterized protein n=1 Tax=Phyllostomus discolor TaxID=89673 RepID=A0A834BCY4_9CHIR|nr:hypothetical protein HJG60_009926 [Phyllostomus discolor]
MRAIRLLSTKQGKQQNVLWLLPTVILLEKKDSIKSKKGPVCYSSYRLISPPLYPLIFLLKKRRTGGPEQAAFFKTECGMYSDNCKCKVYVYMGVALSSSVRANFAKWTLYFRKVSRVRHSSTHIHHLPSCRAWFRQTLL